MQIQRLAGDLINQAETKLESTARKLAAVPDPGVSVELSPLVVALLESSLEAKTAVKLAHTGDDLDKAAIDLIA